MFSRSCQITANVSNNNNKNNKIKSPMTSYYQICTILNKHITEKKKKEKCNRLSVCICLCLTITEMKEEDEMKKLNSNQIVFPPQQQNTLAWIFNIRSYYVQYLVEAVSLSLHMYEYNIHIVSVTNEAFINNKFYIISTGKHCCKVLKNLFKLNKIRDWP